MISSTLKIHPNSLYRWIQEYEKYDEVRSHDMGAHFVILNLRCSKMKNEIRTGQSNRFLTTF